jgi:hypothetical protein
MVWRITGAVTLSEIWMFHISLSPCAAKSGEQVWDYRHIAYLMAAEAEAACDAFKRGPAEQLTDYARRISVLSASTSQWGTGRAVSVLSAIACSSASATPSTFKSDPRGPMIWIPKGKPL